jgi:Probable zinc-ribbon domain
MKPARRQPVPVDKDRWSEKSQGGLDYVFAPENYEDKPFACRACGQKAVFTAEQQKYTYEVKKAFTWEQHVLCAACFRQRNELLAEATVFAASWAKDKALLKRDRSALQRWKEVLELLPTYGIRKDGARIRMLTKALENVA